MELNKIYWAYLLPDHTLMSQPPPVCYFRISDTDNVVRYLQKFKHTYIYMLHPRKALTRAPSTKYSHIPHTRQDEIQWTLDRPPLHQMELNKISFPVHEKDQLQRYRELSTKLVFNRKAAEKTND